MSVNENVLLNWTQQIMAHIIICWGERLTQFIISFLVPPSLDAAHSNLSFTHILIVNSQTKRFWRFDTQLIQQQYGILTNQNHLLQMCDQTLFYHRLLSIDNSWKELKFLTFSVKVWIDKWLMRLIRSIVMQWFPSKVSQNKLIKLKEPL